MCVPSLSSFMSCLMMYVFPAFYNVCTFYVHQGTHVHCLAKVMVFVSSFSLESALMCIKFKFLRHFHCLLIAFVYNAVLF